jgi:plastocyanin
MNDRQRLAFLCTLLVATLVACGPKQQTGPPNAPPTPIDQTTVGQVTGTVAYTGARPNAPVIHMDQDPACVAKHAGQPVLAEDAAVNADGTLPNVFVYVKAGAEKYTFAAPSEPIVLAQDGCMYRPHVLGIMVGQTLRITTADATTHNIHSLATTNEEWNLSQSPGGAPVERNFARPEIMIPLKCNQHPWMRAWIGVTINPFFAVTGTDGTFIIKGLPPGDYTIEAWTAFGGAPQTQQKKVGLAPKESKRIDFTFTAP